MGVTAWAFSRRNKSQFEEAGRLPFKKIDWRLYMSDFISNGWSTHVVGIVVFGLVYCVAVLLVAARHKVIRDAQGNIDKTTGHVWDEDLRELNNLCLCGGWVCLF